MPTADPAQAATVPVAGIRYRERLQPPLWLWALVIVGATTLGVAVAWGLGALAGLICGVLVVSLSAWALIATSVQIVVTDSELQVGRAHIPWQFVGRVATLDAESTKLARGPEADPRAFTMIRSLTTPRCVTVEICDDHDPHPYWLVSSADPQELGEHIRHARQLALNSYDHP